MRPNFLGAPIVAIEASPFAGYTKVSWALEFIAAYGQTDGAHHKQWVLDQVARILMGTPVIVKRAAWDNGEVEWRFELGSPSKKYKQWVQAQRRGDALPDEPDKYGYDKGVAP